jgi:hypothetical protein
MIAPINERCYDSSATTLNGTIYVIGGFSGQECMNSENVYDPEVNQ